MRPKFVLAVMLLAVAVLGMLVVLKRGQGGHGKVPDAAVPVDSARVETAAPPETGAAPAATGPDNQVEPLVVSHVADSQAKPPATNDGPMVQPSLVLTNIVATTPEEDRRAAIEKDMNLLNEALLDGGSDPKLVGAVREELFHSDAEVRKTAVETIMHLSDREAIPKLNEALAKTEDPREKVAIMDAIEYLQTPDGDPQFTTAPPMTEPAPTGPTTRSKVQQPKATKR